MLPGLTPPILGRIIKRRTALACAELGFDNHTDNQHRYRQNYEGGKKQLGGSPRNLHPITPVTGENSRYKK